MSARSRAVGSLVVAVGWLLAVAPAAAAAEGVEEYDGRSTEDTVRLVVGGLIGIAALTAVLLVAYVWHTSPRRRARVAARRAGP